MTKQVTTLSKYALLVLFSFFISSISYGQCGQLIWSDEFDGNSLDESKWGFDLGNGCPDLCGWGNAELQNYTNSSNNVRVNNGNLEIEARVDNGSYTSTRLTTEGLHSWQYGRFEMRAKLPAGTGMWPAFWMLPVNGAWPTTGEIDIMEQRGDRTSQISGTLHYGSPFPSNQNDGEEFILDESEGTFTDDFHVFAVEWEQGEIRWFVDNELYHTETRDPNTLNPASTSTVWPWDDQEFYIIINLAIGGENTPFTGFQSPDFGTSAIMEVDYVRVFDSAQPNVSIAGPNKVFDNTTATYSVPNNDEDENYSWTVPTGATITSGQNTNAITVDWGISDGGDVSLNVTHTSGACDGNTFFYTTSVEVNENTCEFNFENFDDPATMISGFRSGVLSEVDNPEANDVNSSSLVGEYVRNGSETFDVIIYENALLDPAPDYVSGEKVLTIDVRTNAPVGTSIELQIGNSEYAALGDFPNGVHSIFSTQTTVSNEWETLTFSYVSSPDPNGSNYDNDLDRMILLFAPNSNNGNTYYFDNIGRNIFPAPTNLMIEGAQSIEENEVDISFSAIGGSTGSTYDWTLPSGATITSGEGTATITVDFALSGGIVAVTEILEDGCTGEPSLTTISVGGSSCALFSDEFDDNSVQWIEVNGDAGFSSSETGSNWTITSGGHDQWATIEYTLNDGLNPISLDFTETGNNPVLRIRAKASSQVLLTPTLVDANDLGAANQFLLPLNRLELTTEYQEFTIDFNGQLWEEFNTGGTDLLISAINKLRFSINAGYIDFPYSIYTSAFVGDIEIDYIRIGDECSNATANFSVDNTVLCEIGDAVTFTDLSIGTDENTSYSWDFGSGASPATATTAGPHTVSYNTSGWKEISLSLNNGESTRTLSDIVYISSNDDCEAEMDFDSPNDVGFFTAFGNFSFSQGNSNLTITTDGYDQWENMRLDINNGLIATPLNFGCDGLDPVLKVRARASSNAALRISMIDVNGIEASNDQINIDNVLELTTEYQNFEINFSGLFTNAFADGGPFNVDSTHINQLLLAINPGYVSFPIQGVNDTYDSFFDGSIDLEIISIGESCLITGIESNEIISSNIQVFPNPFTSELSITGIDELSISEVEILNAQGNSISTVEIEEGTIKLNESLPQGMYFIKMISDSGTFVKPVLKQ